MNFSFWKQKKVFITGHTGFKGSWLSLWLNDLGADVYGYALEPITQPSLYSLTNLNQTISSQIGNICDYEAMKSYLIKSDPEIIFHMAAQPLVRHSYANPIETYNTNVMGTVNLLNITRDLKNLKAVVVITTDKCYQNKEWVWPYRETDTLGGYDPYSGSKACAELVVDTFRQSFFNIDSYKDHGVAIASARAGNVIGGGDWSEDRLIPDFFKAYENKSTLEIRSPNAIRPWQHVLEPLYGYMKLAFNLYSEGSEFSGAWNFGPSPNDFKSVKALIEAVSARISNGPNVIFDTDNSLHEAQILKLDSSKSILNLDWKPFLQSDDAIELTSSWYENYYNHKDCYKFSLEQINNYQHLIEGK